MARPGAPSKVTPALASEIDAMADRRLPLRAIARALAAQGHPLGVSTIRRYLSRRGADCSFLVAPGVAPAQPAQATTPLEQAAAAVLETDDLAALTQTCLEVERALRSYAQDIGSNPSSTRAFAALVRIQTDLRARLVALRPAPEVENDRLTALGLAKRTALIERAREREGKDWETRYRRTKELLDRLREREAS